LMLNGADATLIGTATQYEPYYSVGGTQNMSQSTSDGTERGTIRETGGLRNLTGATSSRNGYQTVTGTAGAD
jgi:hypothetical protein